MFPSGIWNAASSGTHLPERVALLYRFDGRDVVPLMLGAGIAALALWGFIYPPLLISWLVWFAVLRVVRWVMSTVYARSKPAPASAGRWEDRYALVAMLFGAAWGMASVYFYFDRGQFQEMVVTYLISLVSLGLPMTLAPSPRTFVGFITPMVAPLVGMLFARGDVASISVALMMTLYSAMVLWLYLSANQALMERIVLDEKNAALTKAIAEANVRLALALRASQVVIWEWNSARNNVYLDEGWARLTGGPRGETHLSPAQLKVLAHPDEYNRLAALARKNLAGESAEFSAEHQVRTMTGEWKWVMSRGQVIGKTAEGTAQRMIGTMIDISQRKRAEAELISALQREKELSSMKSKFVSMASHEFRTPLATILSSSELIEHYADTLNPEERLGVLQGMQHAVRRMVALLDDVLTIGKSDAGVLRYQGDTVHLRSLCERIVAACHSGPCKQHSLVLQYLIEPDEPFEMDEKLLHHILENLLTNAAKYSEAGKQILLRVASENNQVRLDVADQGIGIPTSEHGRVFEGFFRASNVEDRQGTGLGLAIVKKAVDSHGGVISFTSESGKGTCFTVRLPLRRPVADENS